MPVNEKSYDIDTIADKPVWSDGDVVISGISGKFPGADNIQQFHDKLMSRIDLTGCDYRHNGNSEKNGNVSDEAPYDAKFFNLPPEQGNDVELCGILLEHICEATVDAGVNPIKLRGTKTGVFIGAHFAAPKTENLNINSYTDTISRISSWLNTSGPNCGDSACSSPLAAVDQAYWAMHDGKCDAAVVIGISKSPIRKSAVVAAYLQKAKDAKRIYATLVYSKTNSDGFKENYLRTFYENCKISPSLLEYIETEMDDAEEINVIDRIFATDRKEPLKIGWLKLNDRADVVSGMSQVAKVIAICETGMIPPSLNPKNLAKPLEDKRIQVVTEAIAWKGGYVGINSSGTVGATHILLKSNPKEKINGGAPRDDLPRLVVASGRTAKAVEVILSDVKSRPLDVEYIRLLQDIHGDNTPGHPHRGYTIVGSTSTKLGSVARYSEVKRPVWFVFAGVGCQCPGMGASLLQFAIFANTVKSCDEILKLRRINIYDILTNTSDSVFDNSMKAFIGVTVVQLGLVDLLTSLGILPNVVIGDALGAISCAYARGEFTLKEAILYTFFKAKTHKNKDSTVIVGLNHENTHNHCARNSANLVDNCADVGLNFIEELKKKQLQVDNTNMSEITQNASSGNTKWFSVSAKSSPESNSQDVPFLVLFEKICPLVPKDAIVVEISTDGFLQSALKRTLHPEVANVALTEQHSSTDIFLRGIGELYQLGLQPAVWTLYPEVQYPVSRGTPMISPLVQWEHSLSNGTNW